jgi:hypothetical protein
MAVEYARAMYVITFARKMLSAVHHVTHYAHVRQNLKEKSYTRQEELRTFKGEALCRVIFVRRPFLLIRKP